MTNNTKPDSNVKYALSIFMKYGEVLHVEGVSREIKDKYFELAKNPSYTMLVEDPRNVRNICGADIANISAKKYNAVYEKTTFQAKKMLFSESSIGKDIYFTIIKIFVFIAILAIISQLAIALMSGEIMELISNTSRITGSLEKGVGVAMSVFKYTTILMFLMAVIDIILGLNADYHINQDGDAPVMTKRIEGFIITVVFLIVVLTIKAIL